MNIWEIVTSTDLIKILKENEKRFVIVAITLDSTPQYIIKHLKKFLKTYSKLYQNLTFLYYKANIKDLGRISLLNKNVEEYPYVYHVYDTSNIFVSVNRANEKSIYEAFNAVEEYYKKDLEGFLSNNNEQNTDKSNSNIMINQDMNNKNNKNVMNANLEEDEKQASMNRKAIEHQKLLDKLIIFEEKKKDYNIKFLEDIQKRKKEEQKKLNE